MCPSRKVAAPSWSRWIPVVSSAALAACASSAHEQRYHELSRALASEARAEAEAPLPEGPVLERAELVRAVLARNPGIDEARQAWRAALAEVPQASALADPMAEYMFAPLSIGSDEHGYGQIVTLSQELPWPAELDLREQVALAEAEAARADFRGVQLRLALSASMLFDEYYAAARSLAITAEHERLVRDILAISEAQYQAGRTTQSDVLEAEVELAHIEHRQVTLEAERDIAVARLNGLLHRPPGASLPPPPETLEVPAGEVPPVDALVQDALAARPELAARRARIEARDAAVDLAERDYYPDVRLMASYDSMQASDHELMVGVGLALPIWRERRAAAVDEARAQRASTAAALEAARDQIRAEVAAARHRLVEARHVVHLYGERLIPTARAQVDAARIGYETGSGEFQALIAAERNRRQLELDRELALATLQKRRAELERALGRVPGLEVSR